MLKTIEAKDLRVGMFVILPEKWSQHPGLKNRFLIRTEAQLTQLLASTLEEVQIDSALSQGAQDVAAVTHPPDPVEVPDDWHPEQQLTQELREAINDPKMAPEVKARMVYRSSLQIMKNLFDNPNAHFIGEGKKAIAMVADMILSDDDTASNMLRLTSHDFYTYSHSVNVGVLSIYLAKRLYGGSAAHDMHELGAGFFLHDLGKVRVDPAIINKPGRLTDDEMKLMRIHPYQSYKVLQEAKHLSEECKVIAMQHHEREDGTGYPRRLMGDQIHDYARICCIADVYDALTAERSYKRPLSPFKALNVMKDEMLGFFHQEIFENFVMLFH